MAREKINFNKFGTNQDQAKSFEENKANEKIGKIKKEIEDKIKRIREKQKD